MIKIPVNHSFQKIEDIQQYIDENQVGFENEGSFTRYLTSLIGSLPESDKEKLQSEIYALDFIAEEGEIRPAHTFPMKDGLSGVYPAYEKFSDITFDYLNNRVRTTSNPLLKARYIQVLWNSPRKNRDLAKEGVDIYLECLRSRVFLPEAEDANELLLDVLKNGFSLACHLKHLVEEYQQYADKAIDSDNTPDDIKLDIVEFMMNNSKIKSKNLKSAEPIVRAISDNYRSSGKNYHEKNNADKTGLALAQKCSLDVKDWHRRIAENIEDFAVNQIQSRAAWAAMDQLKEAINHYKNAGLEDRVANAEKIYSQLKDKVELAEVPISIELPDVHREYLALKTEAILEFESDDIFSFLSHGNELFPTKESLEKIDRKNHFLDLLTTIKIDINVNVSKRPEEGADLDRESLYDNYKQHAQCITFPILRKVFIEGFRQNKITYEGWLKFVLDNSWFGQPLLVRDTTGKQIELRWISLLAQPVHYYFECLDVMIKNNQPMSFVMAIDSYTTKFEAALRDFARLCGISTSIAGKGGVMREMYIEELLAEEKVLQYFNEDDILFFKFVFMKNGLNLRNNVAHGFLRFRHYSIDHMHLLICAFLRLGKYKLTIAHADVQNS